MGDRRTLVLECLRDPGYTPKARDADLLASLLSDDAHAGAAAKGLVRLGAFAVPSLSKVATSGGPGAACHALEALGAIVARSEAQSEALMLAVSHALGAGEPRVRRIAIRVAGKGGLRVLAPRLRDAYPSAPLEEKRAIVEALGRIDGIEARSLLEDAARQPDKVLSSYAKKALIKVERDAHRAPSEIDLDRAFGTEFSLSLFTRAGLETIVCEELEERLRLRGRVRPPLDQGGARAVDVDFNGPLRELYQVRTFGELGIWLDEVESTGDAARDLIAALTSAKARSVFALTRGVPRLRIALETRSRATQWELASHLREVGIDNDPRDSTFELRIVRSAKGSLRGVLVPRVQDPRFTYRIRTVAAASHPTIAAALACVARAQDGDVVWDPFVGSGAELVECALRGVREAQVFGTDTSREALACVAANAGAGGFSFHLAEGDARTFTPPERPTLIVTNPPMGRRVRSLEGLANVLEEFLEHVSRILAPGGRLVWLRPPLHFSNPSGLVRRGGVHRVDLGGFEAELEVLVRPT